MNSLRYIINTLVKQVTEFGGLAFYSVVVFLLLLLGEINTVTVLILSLVSVMLLATAIKKFFPKERPDGQKGRSLVESIDSSSFPSVHSMRIVSLAFWLSIFFSIYSVSIFLWAIAALVMSSRIVLKRHYGVDVIAGAIISLIINSLIWWFI